MTSKPEVFMSLRMRLFVLIGGLAAALVLAQVLLVRSLSADVSGAASQAAFRVGEGLVTHLVALTHEPPRGEGAPSWSPGPPGTSQSVTERAFYLKETDTSLVLLDQRVSVGHVSGGATLPRTPGPEADATAQATGDVAYTLRVDSPMRARFLELHGPAGAEKIPIPFEGFSEVLDAFQRRLMLGSGALLLVGLLLAAAIAHRSTAPLRELSRAARSLGEGQLGTQVRGAASGEVQEAILAFNRMSSRLAELDAESRRLREREHLTEIGEIARGLAHGLRNPLNALGLSVDELARAAPAGGGVADTARRQIRRIDQAVRSFLALATSGKPAPEEDVDVVALVQGVVLEVLQDGRGRVSAGLEAAPGLPTLRGVPAEIRAVAQALVVNAVEASPDGARVQARLEEHAGGLRLIVDDEGPGLADDVRAKLFTPHVTTKASGSGMGLYLAHRLVAARGGDLTLEPREPRGTRASVLWPAGTAEEAHG